MVGELKVTPGKVDFRHVTLDASLLRDLASLHASSSALRMTTLAFHVVVSRAFNDILMRVVTPDTTDTLVSNRCDVALARGNTIWLKTNVVDVMRSIGLYVLPSPVALAAEI
jgi:hypothetical protein